MTSYDFGYSWWLTHGHLVVALGAAIVALLAWRFHWPRWGLALSILVALWGGLGATIVHLGLESPAVLPTARFLPSGSGRVLDMGAGSGRATLMVLLERPQATVTALDIYSGYFGIENNTPERLMANARVAGVADRAEATVGDMRRMPFADGTFDAALSAFAIDHLPRNDIPAALAETARVLRPRGQFLFMGLNVDVWVRTAFPLPPGHGYWTRSENAARWRTLLANAGFDTVEEGTRPATLYLLAQKRD
jgi:SAM-dependent methyltransferase